MTYPEKLKDPRWQKKRLCVMERDQFKCRDCGSDSDTLDVHHCHYEKGNPWDTADRFLLTLCEECHTARGDLEADAKRAVAVLMARMGNRPDDLELSTFVGQLKDAADDTEHRPHIIDHEELLVLDELARVGQRSP